MSGIDATVIRLIQEDTARLRAEAEQIAAADHAGNAQLRHLTTDLATAKRGLAVMLADATRLQRRLVQSQAEAAQWHARAERALRVGDAPLARQALARKLDVQRIAGQYADAQTAQQRSLAQVRAAVVQLEARLRAVRAARPQGWSVRLPTAGTRVAHDQGTVESQFEKFELDQAMDALRRKVQGG